MRTKSTVGLAVLAALLQGSAMASNDLYFSEYVEGSSNNKALEVYNGTGANLDLSGYQIRFYFNGAVTPGFTIDLSGMIADGDVHVVANSAASAEILAVADQTKGGGWFNGNDAVELSKDGQVLDVIGQIGDNPGSQWGSGLTSTQDNTLRRKADITDGDADGSDAFDPAVEWDGFANNTIDGLGSHTANNGGGGADITSIFDIQFTENADGASPLVGQTVTTEGVVTAVFGSRIFIQDGSGAWRGLLIFQPSVTPVVGDRVQVTGEVGEFFGQTQIANGELTVLSNGSASPAAQLLATGAVADEQWESVLVRSENVEVSNANPDAPSDFGEFLINDGSGDVRVDDLGSITFNPVGGESLDFVQGPLHFSFNNFKIVPRDDDDLGVDAVSACGAPADLIHEVQGNGAASPLVGQNVTIEGVVVADFQDGLSGYYIQEEDADADADPATSEGIFVFTGNNPQALSVGDKVRVSGEVVEFFNLTELSNTSGFAVCDSGLSVTPAEVNLPFASADEAERFEGMSVVLPQQLTVSENFNLGRFGEVLLSSGRLFQPTHVALPGVDAQVVQEANDLNRITLDDGRTTQNPEPIIHPAPGLSAFNTLRGGDTVTGLNGVMHFAFGNYRIHPVGTPAFVADNPRPIAPELGGEGSLRVASFNVLNYFTTIDENGNRCGPNGDLGCRGADSASEFQRQKDKIVNAITGMQADIIGLMELENNGYQTGSAIADLVEALNAAAPLGTEYAFVDPGVPAIGTDAIAVGLIYNTETVKLIGTPAILDSGVDPRFVDSKNRPTLAASFREKSSRERLTIAVNHLKSKGSPCDDIGDPNADDGQANCNGTRTAAAEAMVDWLATNPTGVRDNDVMIIGDLNAYAKEDPIRAIENGGYTNLISDRLGEEAYSFVFFGQAGYLDHALASASLVDQVTDITEWHINADEPRVLDYNEEFQSDAQVQSLYNADSFRASDHDPVIVELQMLPRCDLNKDARVNWRDFRSFRRAFGSEQGDDAFLARADLDSDGDIDRRDFRQFKRCFIRNRLRYAFRRF